MRFIREYSENLYTVIPDTDACNCTECALNGIIARFNLPDRVHFIGFHETKYAYGIIISLVPRLISQAFTASHKSLGDKPGNEAV